MMDDEDRVARWREGFARMTDAAAKQWVGAWMRHSDDGGQTWGAAEEGIAHHAVWAGAATDRDRALRQQALCQYGEF